MKRFRKHLFAASALLLAAAPAYAHHGTAGSYDDSKVVKISGTVKEFRWRNPHSALFVIARDASGKELTYALEMGSPATLARFGYTRTTIQPGDKVVFEMHPSFTNPANGYAQGTLSMVVNGKSIRNGQADAQ